MQPERSASDFREHFPYTADIRTQILYLLGAATRAPSTHNCQPWRFRIDGNKLFVYRDTRIKLPQSDPVNKYAHISIGFLLHHITVLAQWLSMSPKLVPILKDDCVAEIDFSRATKPGDSPALASAIFTRRNRRGVFEKQQIPQEVLDSAVLKDWGVLAPSDVAVLTGREGINKVADATATVMKRIYGRSTFRREMAEWITRTGTSRKDGVPGYSLNQSAIMSWFLPTIIRNINMGPVLAKLNHESISSARAVFGFGSENDVAGYTSVGYAASHAALALTARGYNYSVFIASLEYDDTRKVSGDALGLQSPQFLFVAGVLPGEKECTWMTPRIPVEEKLITP